MALSDWAALAFDPDGKPSRASLRQGSICCCIRKGYLVVEDTKVERLQEEWGLTLPAVVHVTHGQLRYGPLSLTVARHDKQGAIFVLACFVYHSTNADGELVTNYRRMAGIGCGGYLDDLDWIKLHRPEWLSLLPAGVPEAELMFGKTSECNGPEGDREWSSVGWFAGEDHTDYQEIELPEVIPSTYVGVQPETYEAFLSWLRDELRCSYTGETEYLQKILKAEPLQYNQGSGFFADACDEETPAYTLDDPAPAEIPESLMQPQEEA